MCSASDPGSTIELEIDDFEDVAVEEPSFSRLEEDFFAEGDEMGEAEESSEDCH
jgi:hypothetical protein